VYHGPKGLKRIAERVHDLASRLAKGLKKAGYQTASTDFFDTLRVELGKGKTKEIIQRARQAQFNLGQPTSSSVSISIDETTSEEDVEKLAEIFGAEAANTGTQVAQARKTMYLDHPVFNQHHSETEMLRYIQRLQAKDLSLIHSMIPLGSCTMKLN